MPTSTYRVQLTPDFTFRDAAAIVPYLAELGVSALYASPYLQASPGSRHGYDVVDYGHVSVELGGEEGHRALIAALDAAGLEQVLDVVPNHMAITGPENTWWWDVLENGPASLYASYFDVDWDPPEAKLRNTVLLPILGDRYGRVLERGEIQLRREGGRFVVSYFDHRAPVAPRSLDTVVRAGAERLADDDPSRAELLSLAAAYRELPPATATDRSSVLRRHHDKERLRQRLARLCRTDHAAAAALDEAAQGLSEDPAELDRLLERQNFRLAFWRTAAEELDYRRFFDVTTLAGLRVEADHVFRDTHRLVLDWVRAGCLAGLRIDHPDGLRDPAGYLERLRREAPQTWIVIEKILEPGEALPPSWPVAGTTGYDFLNLVSGLFVDPGSEDAFTRLYVAFTGESTDWESVVHAKKHLVAQEVLAADLLRLTNQLVDVCAGRWRYRDYTRRDLLEALEEVVSCFDVYRTYITEGSGAPADRETIARALTEAQRRRPDIDADLLGLFCELLGGGAVSAQEWDVAYRAQQLTAPVMAKGVEDTAFYTFNRFVGLNEVGGDPSRFGVPVTEFHRWCQSTQQQWPHTMVTLSTHDTKRSEDVRARLTALSEVPEVWTAAVQAWGEQNEGKRAGPFPDRNTEYLLYQTLVGAWPISSDRALRYMEKATREAKVHTSWLNPNAEFDDALARFIEAAFDDAAFMASIDAFVAPLVAPGRANSMAQTLLKLTAAGVPDTYQGTELWELSLVDPDNRREVDFAERARLLRELKGMSPAAIAASADRALPKLHLVHRALGVRRTRPECFGAGPPGRYTPLEGSGDRSRHLIAYQRGDSVVAIAPRLVVTLERAGGWGATEIELPGGRWRNVLTGAAFAGGTQPVAALVAPFPVALLTRDQEP